MRVQRYRDTALFLERSRPFLSRAEAENSMFLGMGGRAFVLDEHCYLATIEQDEQVVACAVRTPPFGLVVTRAEPSALNMLIDDVATKYDTLPSVLGPEPTVSAFARDWSKRLGTRTRPIMQMRLFETRHVQGPAVLPPGRLRLALESDLQTVTAWIVAFHQEAKTGNPIDPVRAIREDIASQHVFVWDNAGAVSIAKYAGRTERSATIGLAYTPPEHRARGYASACVAAVTQRLLGEGLAFCCISADLANSTTNKIYPAIGYRPVCDTSNIDLNVGREL